MFPSPLSRHWAQYWSAPMTSPSARVANARKTFVSTVSLMNRTEPSQSRKWNVPSTNETSRPKEFRAALAQRRHEQEGHDPEDEPGT